MKQLLVFMFLLCAMSVSAQDVIVKKDGSTIVCRVVELTSSEITYKKWSDLNGSNYVMNRADASAINYENGKKVNLSETTTRYNPSSQNDEVQRYNDRALLAIDKDMHKKSKRVKKIGLIAGSALIAAGGLSLVLYLNSHSHATFDRLDPNERVIAFGLMGVGVVTATSCLLYSNHLEKKEDSILNSSLYQYNFKLSDSSSLSAGVDMINDQTMGSNTLGLGLRYNF